LLLTNSTLVIVWGSETIYSWRRVVPSIEGSNWSLFTYLSSSLALLKYLIPKPRPPRLCFVINGLSKFLEFSNKLFLSLQKKVLGNLILYLLLFFLIFYIVKIFYLVFVAWYEQKFLASFSERISSKIFFNYISQNFSFFVKRKKMGLNVIIIISQF